MSINRDAEEPINTAGVINTTPSPFDPAPSPDGGATHKPSYENSADESEDGPKPHSIDTAFSDISGTGGSAA